LNFFFAFFFLLTSEQLTSFDILVNRETLANMMFILEEEVDEDKSNNEKGKESKAEKEKKQGSSSLNEKPPEDQNSRLKFNFECSTINVYLNRKLDKFAKLSDFFFFFPTNK